MLHEEVPDSPVLPVIITVPCRCCGCCGFVNKIRTFLFSFWTSHKKKALVLCFE